MIYRLIVEKEMQFLTQSANKRKMQVGARFLVGTCLPKHTLYAASSGDATYHLIAAKCAKNTLKIGREIAVSFIKSGNHYWIRCSLKDNIKGIVNQLFVP